MKNAITIKLEKKETSKEMFFKISFNCSHLFYCSPFDSLPSVWSLVLMLFMFSWKSSSYASNNSILGSVLLFLSCVSKRCCAEWKGFEFAICLNCSVVLIISLDQSKFWSIFFFFFSRKSRQGKRILWSTRIESITIILNHILIKFLQNPKRKDFAAKIQIRKFWIQIHSWKKRSILFFYQSQKKMENIVNALVKTPSKLTGKKFEFCFVDRYFCIWKKKKKKNTWNVFLSQSFDWIEWILLLSNSIFRKKVSKKSFFLFIEHFRFFWKSFFFFNKFQMSQNRRISQGLNTIIIKDTNIFACNYETNTFQTFVISSNQGQWWIIICTISRYRSIASRFQLDSNNRKLVHLYYKQAYQGCQI